MTDKQIIIDGVDVSGCRFYSEKLSTMKGTGFISVAKSNGFCTHNIRGLDDSSCYDAHIEYAKCKNNNCYYKQLKRKEQECEELKDELLTTKCMVTTQGMQYGRLYEQLDQLKAENEELKNFHINLVGVKECEIKELLKLKQTLAEIKEIAEEKAKVNDWLALEILQKINEVEDE